MQSRLVILVMTLVLRKVDRGYGLSSILLITVGGNLGFRVKNKKLSIGKASFFVSRRSLDFGFVWRLFVVLAV
jgi:hypothetical protein